METIRNDQMYKRLKNIMKIIFKSRLIPGASFETKAIYQGEAQMLTHELKKKYPFARSRYFYK